VGDKYLAASTHQEIECLLLRHDVLDELGVARVSSFSPLLAKDVLVA
jgi:hypothetical protein